MVIWSAQPYSMLLENEDCVLFIFFVLFKSFYCGKKYIWHSISISAILSVRFSDIKYIHIIVQPSPFSMSQTSFYPKQTVYIH